MSRPRNEVDKNDINCIKFSYKQLQEATKNFCESCKLGEGGFGPVFKGTLLYTTVAIKKLRKVSTSKFESKLRQCYNQLYRKMVT